MEDEFDEVTDDAPNEMPEQRQGPPDRRYRVYREPAPRETNWPAIFAALVTIMIALLGYSTTILSDIKRDVRATSDRQIADSSTYTAERAVLRRDIDKAQNDIDTVIKAFQWNVNGRLSKLEIKNGIPVQKEPPPQPQLQGD